MVRLHDRECRRWLFSEHSSLGRAPVELLHEAALQLVDRYVAQPTRKGRFGLASYVRRLAAAVGYHWWRFSQEGFRPLKTVIQAVQSGRLAYGRFPVDVFGEVALVEGVCQLEPEASRRFVAEYADVIRWAAFRAGGPTAQQDLEGFEAELMLHRNRRPPRLATYAGLTPLKYWLGRVVWTEWKSRTAAVKAATLYRPRGNGSASPVEVAAERECLAVLQPLFVGAAAALKKNEELLLRMVLAKGVPNRDVARLWGVHASTVTRVRRRACRKLAERFRQLAARLGRETAYRDCVEWISSAPAGRLAELAHELAGNLWERFQEE